MKIKKILALTAGLYAFVGLALALAVLTTGSLVLAKKPEHGPGHWELVAPSGIDFGCGGGTYSHTLNTVSNNDPSMGMFTGTGTYDPNTSYTWDIDGEISGDDISFTLVYTGINAGYTLHGDGTISSDGSISGTTDGNCQTFSMGAGSVVWAKKVDICHREGNGSYHLISVSDNAIPAHLAHGDGFLGAAVGDPYPGLYGSTVTPFVGDDCSSILRIDSSQSFAVGGWAGWSCVEAGHPHVVGGGVVPETAGVMAQGPAKPGSTVGGSTYPVFPHYTYTPPEEGWVVRAGSPVPTGIFVLCGE